MYQKRLVEAMNEIDDIHYHIRNAQVDPQALLETSLDLESSEKCADLLDDALNKLEAALSLMQGD